MSIFSRLPRKRNNPALKTAAHPPQKRMDPTEMDTNPANTNPASMNRRDILKLAAAGAACALSTAVHASTMPLNPEAPDAPPEPLNPALPGHPEAEQWSTFEAAFHGPADGNPFTEVAFSARFQYQHRTVDVPGFYDGDGLYRVRFMPDTPGRWTFETVSTAKELSGRTGAFTCTPASAENHGPVSTAHQFHFQHADGTPYFPFGTPCYSMAFMGAPYEQQTLDTLKTTGFNKVRLCLLPKPLGKTEIFALPFARDAAGKNDLARLNPAYFQHVEKRIHDLMLLNIQADVILFHPYDAWGYKSMPPEANDLYLKYAVARLSAYRNVWWSVANEYDLVKSKTMKDWDHFFHVIQAADPYSHLRSIHHSRVQYDNSKPWVTHASLQEYDFSKAAEYRAAWGKPILWDEIQYEGNISRRWGNLSPEEMTRRFWLAVVAGTYATHGETYISTDGAPVWSDGGKLHGQSAPRIAFLRSLVERITKVGLNQFDGAYYLSAGQPNDLYLYYFDLHCVGEYDFPLPVGPQFKCTLIDPWNMTATELPGTCTGKARGAAAASTGDNGNTLPKAPGNHITLSGKPGMAALFQKIS